jgi:hypothetical protein
VLALVERNGTARTFHIEANVTADEVRRLLVTDVSRANTLRSDESNLYTRVGAEFGAHLTIHHSSGEYVRGEVHTNTVERYFSVFKRGMKGVYQHSVRSTNSATSPSLSSATIAVPRSGWTDKDRAAAALKGIEGNRLTYRRTNEAFIQG